jgi:hypothetical protein
VSLAVFVGAALFGVGVRAGATPPCRLSQSLDLTVSAATIDGAAQALPVDNSFFFQAQDDDPALGTFVAGVFDPDTGASRDLVLTRTP